LSSGAAGSVTVGGAGSRWDVSSLLVGVSGTGGLTVQSGGTVAAAGVSLGTSASSVTVNGGTLAAGGLDSAGGAVPNIALSDPAGGAALTVGSGNASTTYAGSIADAAGGPGSVAKVGTGTLILTGRLTNTGGYTATGGTLGFSGALVQPGSSGLTAGA